MFGNEIMPMAALASGGLLTAMGVMFGRGDGGSGTITIVLSLLLAGGCFATLAFGGEGLIIADLSKMFLKGVTPDSTYAAYPNIPEHLWFTFQMMFFLITPGLFIGAFAERMKFSAIMVFSVLWSLLVYVPTCYGVWHRANFFGLEV